MEINENTIELFENYLHGSMKQNLVNDFEEKIKSDKDFAEMFSKFKTAKKAITLLGRERFKSNLNTLFGEKEKNLIKAVKRTGIKKILSEIYYSFFVPYENILTARTSAVKSEKLEKAMYLYSKGDYKNASVVFKNLLKKDSGNLTICFYYGISELASNNPESAKKLFKKIISQDKDYLSELARWYLGLSYLKSGNIKSARKHFEDLTNTGKSPDSQKILQEIKNL